MRFSIIEVEQDVGSDVRNFKVVPFGHALESSGAFVAAFVCNDVHVLSSTAERYLVASNVLSLSNMVVSDASLEVFAPKEE